MSYIFARCQCPVCVLLRFWRRLHNSIQCILLHGPRGRVVGLWPFRTGEGYFSAGSRWPAGLGTQRRSRLFGFLHDFAVVERSEFARLAENTAVRDDGVDIARLRQRDKRLVGVADRCHIDIRVRTRMMSARLPGVSEPVFSAMPRSTAPSSVAS